MDDTAQKPNGNVPPQTPSIGIPNKEITPLISDYVTPAPEAGPVITDKEVTAAGITEVERAIGVEREHEVMGVKPSAESTPVRTEPTGAVQLPMTKEEVEKGKSHTGLFNSPGSIYSGINFANAVDFLRTLLKKHLKRLAGQPA